MKKPPRRGTERPFSSDGAQLVGRHANEKAAPCPQRSGSHSGRSGSLPFYEISLAGGRLCKAGGEASRTIADKKRPAKGHFAKTLAGEFRGRKRLTSFQEETARTPTLAQTL